MKTLGLINKDDLYTNLGLLLSEECVHTVKIAVFADTTKNSFLDRREFNGSLLKQLNETYEFILLNNKKQSTYDKLSRIDKQDYDDLVIREALLNALVHREYSFSGSTIINIFTDRIEFISLGGLAPGLSIDDIMYGRKYCLSRNNDRRGQRTCFAG